MMCRFEESHAFTVSLEEQAARLDRFLAGKLEAHGLSREKIKKLILAGKVTVDGKVALLPRLGLVSGSMVRAAVPECGSALRAEEGELRIMYRDAFLVVLDKPAGLVVHPAPGLAAGTLAHRLVAHFPELAAQGGFRPGIVHRLDKDTSGLILAALTEQCRLALAGLFASHAVYKEYLALVHGVPVNRQGVIEAAVGRHRTQKTKMAVTAGGKTAKSAWRVLYADPRGGFALLAVRIYSGRTHQVRVHLEHIGHPLWGDALYGNRASLPVSDPPEAENETALKPSESDEGRAPARQMLHAWKLGFAHPFPEATIAFCASNSSLTAGKSPPAPVWRQGFDGKSLQSISSVKCSKNQMLFCCPPPPDFAEAARFLLRETLRIAITGSPGCGKSSLLKLWRGMGMPVFSADDEVGRLYAGGGDGQRLLHARFGQRFVPDPKRPVDKAALGEAMRDDAALRREVEALIHPLVRHAVRVFWREQERSGARLAAAEIPLYLEADFAGSQSAGTPRGSGEERALPPEAAHVLVGVRCPFALRFERLTRNRGWSGESVARMESWQWAEEKKMAACDLLLDNSGREEDLAGRSAELAAALFRLRRERAARRFARLEQLWME